MADKRKNNGGARKGAGRKPKIDKQILIEKLYELNPKSFIKIQEFIN